MLILTCCYLFLYFSAVIPCSPSMLWFSFPTLTPAVWLNQSDRLWVPGESLPLSAVPFLLKFTLSVTNSFWHLSKCSALCWTAPPRSLHTHTRAHTQSLKWTNSTGEHAARTAQTHTHTHTHTQVHAGTHTNRRIMQRHKCGWKAGRAVPPRHTYYASHASPPVTVPIPL